MAEVQVTVKRERGTLSKTLPKRPEIIFALVNLVATGAAILCCRSLANSRKDWAVLVVGSALSSLATLGGIVYADSAIHSLFLGLAIFATYAVDGVATGRKAVETLSLSLSLSRVLLFVAVASRLPVITQVIAMFSTNIILNPIMISSICCLPLLSFLIGSSMLLAENTIQQVRLPVLSSAILAIATHCLCGLYHRNRSNKHGNLILQKEEQGMTVVVSLAFAWTAQYASQVSASVFLPILAGSAVTSLLSLTFASVADVWDAVGSGQFQMISLDTAALIGYVVAPVLVLASIASNKYGDTILQTVGGMLRSCISDELIQQQEQPAEQTMISGLFLLLALGTSVGVSAVNMLSPVGAYLLSKAYIKGQPRTKRIALCIHFKDLLNESKEKTDATMDFLTRLTTADDTQKVVLNVFVTADELRLFPDMICKLRSIGHAFGICSTTVEELVEAYEAYVEVCKVAPEWYHVGTGTASRGPDALKLATDLNLKVAFWSTHIGVTNKETLLKEHLPNLRQDVATSRGGSFIYLTNNWQDSEGFATAIETIVNDLCVDSSEIQYAFSALSNVAKEDSPMTL